MIYLVVLGALFFLIFIWDMYDMRRTEGVGFLYVLDIEYWACVVVRWALQLGAPAGLFKGVNASLQGNTEFTIPNVVGAIVAAALVAGVTSFGEDYASRNPYARRVIGAIPRWKLRIRTRAYRGKAVRLRRRLDANSDWLCQRLNVSALRKEYKRVHAAKHGQAAASAAGQRITAIRESCDGNQEMYRRKLADEIGAISTVGVVGKLAHKIRVGRRYRR